MDISLVWDTAHFRGDWDVTAGDLAIDAGLRSAVLISLFTDGLAPADFVLTDGTTDRRGVWVDTYERQPAGSLLWLYNRAKKSNSRSLLNAVQWAALRSLQWLIDEGIAASVTVAAVWLTAQTIALQVSIMQPKATASVQFRFAWAWQGV